MNIPGLIAIAYVPGAAIFRAPVLDRDRRARLAADERAFWAVVISVAVSSMVALGLAAASVYTFRRLVVIDLSVSVVVAVLAGGRLRLGPAAARPTWHALLPVALIALGGWLYFPPAEYIIGGKDPGTYLNEGIQIAQRGTLVVRDPVVASVPPPYRDLFFPSYQNPAYYSVRFMGFFILDPDSGAVVGQFPHFFPAWIAIGYGVDGLTGARRAVGCWGILAIVAVYFAGARWFGRTVGFVAATLVGINVVEVWFARYPNSELLTQALIAAALLACTRAQRDGDRFFAPLAGILLGLLLPLRVDALLAVAGVGIAIAIHALNGRRPDRLLLSTLGVMLALGGLYLARWLKPYVAYPIGFVRNLQPLHVALLVVGAASVVALAPLARREGVARPLRRWLPDALILSVIAGVGYAYFLRTAGGRIAIHDAMALRAYAWYVTVPGLFAALLGYVLATRRLLVDAPAFLMTATVYGFFYFYKIRIVPEHFWMSRRFLPIVLPATLLFAAAAAFSATDRLPIRRRAARLTMAAIFIALLGWQYWRASQAILPHVEYAGIIPRLEQLASRFADDDLVIVESRNASDLHVFALPLAYIYARNVLVLNTPAPDKQAFRDFLTWAKTKYRDVFFMGGGGTDLLSRSVAVSAVSSDRFQVPEYESTRNVYPTGVRRKEFDFGVYRFVPPRADSGWFALDVGMMDDLHVVRFQAKERAGSTGETFRWTRDTSYVSLQGVRADSRTVVLWMNDGRRPPGVMPAHPAVYLDEQYLGSVTVGPGFRPYTFAIPAAVASAAASRDTPARLKIVTNTWSPRRALGTPDDRELGVMIDRVEVK